MNLFFNIRSFVQRALCFVLMVKFNATASVHISEVIQVQVRILYGVPFCKVTISITIM